MNDDNINFAMIKYNNGPGFREQLNQKQCFAWNNKTTFFWNNEIFDWHNRNLRAGIKTLKLFFFSSNQTAAMVETQ